MDKEQNQKYNSVTKKYNSVTKKYNSVTPQQGARLTVDIHRIENDKNKENSGTPNLKASGYLHAQEARERLARKRGMVNGLIKQMSV